MDKAYDLKALAEKLRGKGLPVLETTAEQVYAAVKEWYIESATLSANPIDDMGIPFIQYVDALVNPALDKIDGQPG